MHQLGGSYTELNFYRPYPLLLEMKADFSPPALASALHLHKLVCQKPKCKPKNYTHGFS